MFTFFATQESTNPKPSDWSWQDFVADVRKGHDVIPVNQKDFYKQFNAVTYKDGATRRTKENVEALNALVLDYDGGVTIDQVLARFLLGQKLEFVLFTSFNHRRAKFEGDVARDKFRVVIPFNVPCPKSEWEKINNHVLTFAPGVDPAVKKIAQIYTYRACPEETKDAAKVLHITGGFLDWTTWPKNTAKFVSVLQAAKAQGKPADHYLPADHIFRTSRGPVRFGDVTGMVGGVYCPH